MPNAYPPPPLSRSALAWRYGLAGAGYLLSVVAPWFSSEPLSARYWLGTLFGALGFVLIGWRRRWPVTVTLALIAMDAVVASTGILTLWAIMSVSTRRRWGEIVTVSAASLAGAVITALTRPYNPLVVTRTSDGAALATPAWLELGILVVLGSLMLASLVAVGMFIGARRDSAAALRDRLEIAGRERELLVRQGETDERNRIAREMHDVLAHRLSMISMHAGAMTYREDLSAGQLREVAATIRDNAHASLEELRGLLGVLRSADIEVAKPQPTLAQLPQVIDEARSGGSRVEFSASIADEAALPDALGRHAYRIVQEGLTNARKHAPEAKVSVAVSGARGAGLTIVVSNPVNGRGSDVPGSGVGLLGLRERAAMTGGQVASGERDGIFELKAWLPW